MAAPGLARARSLATHSRKAELFAHEALAQLLFLASHGQALSTFAGGFRHPTLFLQAALWKTHAAPFLPALPFPASFLDAAFDLGEADTPTAVASMYAEHRRDRHRSSTRLGVGSAFFRA